MPQEVRLTDRPAFGAELGPKTWRETRKELRELTQRLRGEKREVSEPRKPVQMTFLLKPATNGIFRSFPINHLTIFATSPPLRQVLPFEVTVRLRLC